MRGRVRLPSSPEISLEARHEGLRSEFDTKSGEWEARISKLEDNDRADKTGQFKALKKRADDLEAAERDRIKSAEAAEIATKAQLAAAEADAKKERVRARRDVAVKVFLVLVGAAASQLTNRLQSCAMPPAHAVDPAPAATPVQRAPGK